MEAILHVNDTPKVATVRQHHDAGMRPLVVDPSVNGLEQIMVGLIVRAGEALVSSGMAMMRIPAIVIARSAAS
jgi:hypothetical protein